MRKIWMGVLSAGLASFASAPALAQSGLTFDVSKPVEQCIRDNAPAVEQAIDHLPDAVNFLVGDLCLKPIADDQERIQREKLAAFAEQQRAECEADRPTETSTGASDKKQADPCSRPNPLANMLGPASLFAQTTAAAARAIKPAAPTSLAASILLKLRLDRLKAAHMQGSH